MPYLLLCKSSWACFAYYFVWARLDAYWKRGGGGPTFTALLEKLILLQDNDFGPDIEAFATLQYDLILR